MVVVNPVFPFAILFATGQIASTETERPSSYHAGGCLAQRGGQQWSKTGKVRMCNSQDDDATTITTRNCRQQDDSLNYLEIRIFAQNWEGAYLNAWILQIVLSELLGVPSTIEAGVSDLNLSFYDPSIFYLRKFP